MTLPLPVAEIREQRTLRPYYQPIIDRKARLAGYELLTRQAAKDGTFLSIDFEALSDTEHLLINKCMLRHLELDVPFLHSQGAHFVSINVSPALTDSDYRSALIRLAQSMRRIGMMLWVEILETDPLSTDEMGLIATLREAGVTVALDDVGVRESSFLGTLTTRFDVIKLDRRCLLAATRSKRVFQVLRELVHSLAAKGLRIVCEGIETSADEQLAQQLGCQYQQGYAHGRPAPLPVPMAVH
ncbi:EAL domain-containing protein [Andreprevotia chitinilytica]|uniref:EAL domain-containing protein n=1 Tax=Andreprevotia chitinilytica TaxID=396808 RepID=UPI0014703418|nr:EAL domain-containing protein [Andreprevotia chitinilytica]